MSPCSLPLTIAVVEWIQREDPCYKVLQYPALSQEAKLQDFIHEELWHLTSKPWLDRVVRMEEDMQTTLLDPCVTSD